MLLQKALLLLPTLSLIAADTISCGADSHCPESAPCCNQYGTCGIGSYCLGGCNPDFSFKEEACMPMPMCKNSTTYFNDSSAFVDQSSYLGDPDDGDWYYTGYVADFDGSSILAMPNQTTGTVLSSTRFIWYGKVAATFKAARSSGVVSAFIFFSNIQDEIDWEFVGSQLETAETNFYYEAVLNYSNVVDVTTTDIHENYHTYEVDWTEETLTWYLDGVSVRTLNKADTWNETTNTYHYPQTPSRIQFSLWPVGSSAGIGTQEWAGTIDWDAEDIKEYGYFYVLLKNASVTCYDPPSYAKKYGSTAYEFDGSGDYQSENVIITDNSTILNDDDSTGLNNTQQSSSSSSSASDSSTISSNSSSSTMLSNSSHTTTKTSTTSKKTTSKTSTSSSTSTSTTSAQTGFFQFAQSTTDSLVGSSKNIAAAVVESGSLLSLVLALVAAFGAF
ncbi:hypothetical protein WICPIJ_009002 [Wickerhamomyces pijperi]|uniref:GH16 domain-containing protein n=1 Tax=Wickerhamomyces pijperi TaxID=599730 RepID=A0A9P8PSE9_WICPI|nr:hypothetical protein WICPIJ_009002 [Wickerhamomyces pijperi]